MPSRSVLQHAGKDFRTHKMSKRIQSITVSAIKEMSMLAMQYDDVVPFAWGLPSFPTPEHILKATSEALLTDPKAGMYAPLPGIASLRQAAADTVKRKFGVDVEAQKEVLITVGAMEALIDVFQCILDPGDEVLMTTPGFASHIEQIILIGGVPVFVPLVEEEGWRLDIEELKKKISSKTKALILCNPVNPTGNLISEQQMREIAELAIQHDFFIVTDEPYNFLVYDHKQPFVFLQIPELKKNLISVFSLSKEYCMTGFRIGYVVAEEGVINQVAKAHDCTVISACTISQLAALAALNGPQDCATYFRDELQKRRDIMCERLDRLSHVFSYVKPEGAYYIFVKLVGSQRDAIPLAIDILEKVKVSIVPGDAFGSTGKGHFRFCFGTTEERIIEGFDRLDRYFAEVK
ncbi:MAG: pyridoxal phosphate-dependent aminotransferase [bacterium]